MIKSIDRKKINQAVRGYAQNLRDQNPEILRIIWFGSWVRGHPHPGSDVDLCLLLSHTDLIPHERPSFYLPVGFPVGLDLLVYTRLEFELLEKRSPDLYYEIANGIEI